MKKYTSEEPQFSEEIDILETTDAVHADNVNITTVQLLQNTLVNHNNITELNESMVTLKKSVGDGKSAVASAITSKLGISTASDASFEQMANNILSYSPNFKFWQFLKDTYCTISNGVLAYSSNNTIVQYGGKNIDGGLTRSYTSYHNTFMPNMSNFEIYYEIHVDNQKNFLLNMDITEMNQEIPITAYIINKTEYESLCNEYYGYSDSDLNDIGINAIWMNAIYNELPQYGEWWSSDGGFSINQSYNIESGDYIFVMGFDCNSGFIMKCNDIGIALY